MNERHDLRDFDGGPVDHQLLIRLMGDFQVVIGGRAIGDDDWRLANARTLIKLLALAPKQRLHREQVIEMFWPDLDPDAAANNLRYTLHVARRTLDPDRRADDHVIQYRRGWISLKARAGIWIDAVAFEEAAAVAEAEADLRAHYRALDLYAGELLPGDRYADWAIEERERLHQRQLGLLRTMARLHLERGEFDLAIAALEQVVEIEPVDEDARIQLMQLFAGVGLRHQALLQYQQLREALVCELDAEPSPAVRQLHRHILSGHVPADDEVRLSQRGLDETLEVRRERISNLPASLTGFFGREPEIAELLQMIPAVRLVTLTGPGGAGKTRLAFQVAEDLGEAFRDGIWLVDLSGTMDPVSVPQQVATVLDIRDQPGCSLLETLILYLRGKRTLLIVDSCEHLLDACASLIYDLLQSCPDLHILATSRELLRVPGEVVRQVRPLSCPKSTEVSVVSLRNYEAVNLFVERARLVRPDLALSEDTAPAIAEICRRLDGMPLAIELAAARTRTLPLGDIAARLASPISLLDHGSRVVSQRHQTLEAAIDWSFSLLSGAERILIRRLAVFGGGWTIDAAKNVAAGEGVSASDVDDLMGGLVDKSLVTVADGEGNGRYRFLETIRQYALVQLDRAGERAAIRLRHADYYMKLGEVGESRFRGREQTHWLAWWRREQDNVRAALDVLIECGLRHRSLRFGATLWRFWAASGRLSEGRRWFARLLGDGDPESTVEYMRVLFGDGRLAYAQGDYPGASARFAESLQLARELGDQDFVAGSLIQLGHVAVREGDYSAARENYEEGLIIRRRQGDGWYLAVVLDGLGQVATAEGDYLAARHYYQESLALYRRSGDRAQIARSLALLGHLDYLSGDFTAAHDRLAESLSNSQAANNQQGMALAYAGLGHVAVAQGDSRHGGQLFEHSRRIYKRIGAQRTVTSEIDILAWPPETNQDQCEGTRLHGERSGVEG